MSSNLNPYYLCLPPVRPKGEVEHVIAVAQQSLYLGNSAMLAGVNFINASVIVLCTWTLVDPLKLWGWFLAISFLSFLGLQIWRKARSMPQPKYSSGRFLSRAEVMAGVAGLLWGAPILLFDIADPMLAMFFLLVASGMVSGFVSMLSQCPRISLRFVIGASVPSFVSAITVLDSYSLTLGTLIIVLGVALMMLCLRNFSQMIQSIGSRHDAQVARARLLDAIEAVDDAFAIHDASGLTTISNARYRQWFPNGIDLAQDSDSDVQRLSDRTWVLRSVKSTSDGSKVSIHKDVTSLKVREQQLIAARREAEEADAAKARFMSTMSQELRAPLNAINTFSQVMSSQSNIDVAPEDMRRYADAILGAGEHLLTVINDIIEFSQVGSDRYIHDPRPQDLRELIEKSAILSQQFSAGRKSFAYEVSVAESVGQIIVDEAAFRRVLMSLLSNAIKFGGADPRIVIKAFVRPEGGVTITVRDFGDGIAAKDLERVFEPFYQCAESRSDAFSGTGLGLTLARELVKLHGGALTLQSRVGVGTTVSIELPASAHIPQARQPRSETGPSGSLTAVA